MIKFISYTGAFPNLCSGVLTVEIDGKEYKFGDGTDDNFDPFWLTGGMVCSDGDWNMWATQCEWKLDRDLYTKVDSRHPKWLIDILPQLLEVFNENVPHGCCGGCI